MKQSINQKNRAAISSTIKRMRIHYLFGTMSKRWWWAGGFVCVFVVVLFFCHPTIFMQLQFSLHCFAKVHFFVVTADGWLLFVYGRENMFAFAKDWFLFDVCFKCISSTTNGRHCSLKCQFQAQIKSNGANNTTATFTHTHARGTNEFSAVNMSTDCILIHTHTIHIYMHGER